MTKVLQFLREGAFSLFSDGKLSLKRLLSFIFMLAILYMVWGLMHNMIPKDNQETFRHVFDVIAILIVLLTGAATIKDIIALKNGTKAESDTTTVTTKIDQTITK